MPIKICAIEPAGQQYGSELALLDILIGLDRTRFSTEVILPKGSSFRRRLIEFNVPALEFLRIDLSTGRNVRRLISYARIILHWIVNPPDVILVNQAGILRGIALCNLLIRRPIVCCVSTLEDADHTSRLPAWVFRHVHQIVCNSEFIAARVRNDTICGRGQAVSDPDKKQVVYSGYFPKNIFSERPPWDQNNKDHRFVIGVVGRICKSKGHDLLIHALRFLNDKDSKWMKRLGVVFIGDYQQQEKDEMLQLIAQAPINIEVTGYRTNIAPELSRLHLLLIPSISEPFGRVVQEAAEAGLPVIASDNGGLGEICKKYHYGALFNYPDIACLSRLIEQTIENYNRVLAESHKNREPFLAEFTFEKYMNEIGEILLDACEYPR